MAPPQTCWPAAQKEALASSPDPSPESWERSAQAGAGNGKLGTHEGDNSTTGELRAIPSSPPASLPQEETQPR